MREEHDRWQFEHSKKGRRLYERNSLFVGLLIVLLTTLLLHSTHKQKPRIARYGTQMICPSCGLITSRLKPCCMECGKPLTRVAYSTVEK